MMLGIPIAIWFGILTILSVFTTFSLGIAMHVFKKKVFKYHITFAFITVTPALIHATLAFLLYFYGINP